MANSDYTVRGTGAITPSGYLVFDLTPGQINFTFGDYTSSDNEPAKVGDGVLIGKEILMITNVDVWPSVSCIRGCADTIPAHHPAGEKAWVFTTLMGSDYREYIGAESIGVKLLMRSTAQTVPIDRAPPRSLHFNQRFARPYPPGNLFVNGTRYYLLDNPHVADDSMNLTWAHRDRVDQADVLIGHTVGDIGPEPGTEYFIEVYTADDIFLRLESTTNNFWTYHSAWLRSDFLFAGGNGYLKLYSTRDGFQSWQAYKIPFTVPAITSGWGADWGSNFGSP